MRTNIILASLLALVGYAYTGSKSEVKNLQKVIEFQENAGMLATEVVVENSDQKIRLHSRYLEDDTKIDYRSLIPLIEQLRSTVNDIKKSKESLVKKLGPKELLVEQKDKLLDEFIHSTKDLMKEQRAIMNFYLVSNNYLFGLREKEIKSYNDNVFDQLRFDHWKALHNDLQKTGNHHAIIVNGLYLELTAVVDKVINSLTGLSGGRAIFCNFGIPINVYLIKRGDYPGDLSTILFDCPGFSLNRNVPNVRVKVNGKQLKIDHNGIAIYQGHRRRNGKLKIEYSYTNPLTGKQYEDEFGYSLDGKYIQPLVD